MFHTILVTSDFSANSAVAVRPAIAIALPEDERQYVVDVLREAEFEPVVVGRPEDLAALLSSRHDIAVAILDGESDFDESLEYYGLLHEPGRDIPALMIVSARTLDRLAGRPDLRAAAKAMMLEGQTVAEALDLVREL